MARICCGPRRYTDQSYHFGGAAGPDQGRYVFVQTEAPPITCQASGLAPNLITEAQLVLADLDGCLVSDGRAFRETAEFVEACGERLWIVSNNSTHTAATLSAELAAIGVCVDERRIMLAGEQTLCHLRDIAPGASIALYASPCLHDQARAFGLHVDATDPEHVILCRDLTFAIPQLETVIAHCQSGAQLWVSNVDQSHPAFDGRPIPETGALLAALRSVIGDVPFECIGKPHTHMAQQALAATGARRDETVFLGDNPCTDGMFAAALGIPFVHIVRERAA